MKWHNVMLFPCVAVIVPAALNLVLLILGVRLCYKRLRQHMQSASIEDGQPPDDHKHPDLQQQKHIVVLQPDYKVWCFNNSSMVEVSRRASGTLIVM